MYFESTETSRNFTLTTMQDEIFEPNENFVVFLQVLSEYQKLGVYIDSANNEAIITIVNDDGKIQYIYHPFILMDVFLLELAITFDESHYAVFENDTMLRVQLKSSQPPYRSISLTVKPIAVNVTSIV